MDESQIEYLRDQLPVCSLNQFPVLRTALLPHKIKLTDTLWQVALDDNRDAFQRFHAAAALAEYAPDDERWQDEALFVSQHLTSFVTPDHRSQWLQLFQTARSQLTGSLIAIHANRNNPERQREAAAIVLSEYLQDQLDKLLDVVFVAEELVEFSPLLSALQPHVDQVRQRLLDELQAALPVELDKINEQLSEKDQQVRDAHWKRRSLAAVILVQLGCEDAVWPLLKFTTNPSLRSYIIHFLGKLGTNHNPPAASPLNKKPCRAPAGLALWRPRKLTYRHWPSKPSLEIQEP